MEATRSDLLPVGAQRADSGVGRVVSSQFTWTPVDWRRVFATQPWLLLLLVTCFALVPSQLYEMLKPPPDRHYSKPNGPYPGEALLTRPMKTETVPTWILAVSNIAHLLVLSALELLLAPSFHRTGTSAWQSSLLLLVDGAVINAVVYSVVSVIKRSVGRLRPDYFARLAAGDESAINQGTLSYPSGHAALAATCGAYWALHLTWTLYYRNRQGSAPLPRVLRWQGDLKAFGKIVLVGLGPAVAGFISVSRVIDNRHHPSDINAGALIGIVATILLWAQTRVPAASRERMAAEEAKGGGQV